MVASTYFDAGIPTPGFPCLPWLFEQAAIKSKLTIKIKKMLKCLFTIIRGNYKRCNIVQQYIIELKFYKNMTAYLKAAILCYVAFNSLDFAQVFRSKPEFLRVEWVANNFEH